MPPHDAGASESRAGSEAACSRRSETIARARMTLAFDFDAHAAGGAFDHSDGLVHAAGIQVGHLLLRDVFALSPGDLGDLVDVGTPLPLAMPAACFSSDAAGGLLVMKSKLRSL